MFRSAVLQMENLGNQLTNRRNINIDTFVNCLYIHNIPDIVVIRDVKVKVSKLWPNLAG